MTKSFAKLRVGGLPAVADPLPGRATLVSQQVEQCGSSVSHHVCTCDTNMHARRKALCQQGSPSDEWKEMMSAYHERRQKPWKQIYVDSGMTKLSLSLSFLPSMEGLCVTIALTSRHVCITLVRFFPNTTVLSADMMIQLCRWLGDNKTWKLIYR